MAKNSKDKQKSKRKSDNTNQTALFQTEAESLILPHPFLKWAGGKVKLAKLLKGMAPAKYNTYFEPFLGAGSLFFELHPRKAYLSDLNRELINVYKVLRDEPQKLYKALQKHIHTEEYYYTIREADRKSSYNRLSPAYRASRLIYLNKTCYNGLYRVNSLGQFNVPFGRYKNPVWFDKTNLEACHHALQNIHLDTAPFESVLIHAKAGDFVYFDPPYAPLSATSNFTSYNADGFGEEEQERLKEVCDELDKKGVKWMQSNSSAPLILKLYKNYKILKVENSRAINSKPNKRGKILEILITNY